VRVQVSGQKDLFRLAHNLHAAGQKGLKKELDKASRQAGKVIEDEVKAHTREYIPQGFEHRFDVALATKVEVRLVASRRISVLFWASGKRERRDIQAINAGRLRHPVFGRMRRLKDGTLKANPWVLQAIRPGLVDEPAKRAMPRAIDKIEDAVKRVVDQIERNG
jgi:hypothetical protein